MSEELIGRGERVAGKGDFGGSVRAVEKVDEVLTLLDEDLSGTILLTEHASATALGPILPRLAGVICTKGGPSAHLAIVSRALQLPCVMGVELERELESGTAVRVDAEGGVWVA